MRKTSPRPTRSAVLRVLLAGLPVLAACGDGTGSGARTVDDLPLPRGTVAVLSCSVRMAPASVECGPAPAAQKSGRRDNLHLLGGQGTYVRLASSNVAYDGGTQVMSFDVSVQNLSNLAFATADGTTRHDGGVQVFFAAPPSTTGGSGTVTVANATGQASFTAAGQDYFQYGGKVGGADQGELGADGILATGEVSSGRQWRMNVPASATAFTFQLYVATETPAGAIASAAPQVTSISPATLVPGAAATLTGVNFNATAASNTVTIGGVAAAVTGGGATSLSVTVPCTISGQVPVQVAQGGMKGAAFAHPLQGNVRTLAPGQSVIVTSAAQAGCNELASAEGAARYTVAVFNDNPSPDASAAVQVSGDAAPSAAPPAALRAPAAVQGAAQPFPMPFASASGARHLEVMENGRRQATRLQARFRGDPRMRADRVERAAVTAPPATRTFHVANIYSPSYCDVGYSVNATRVYLGSKVAIYEDDATPAALKAASNPTMQDYYNRIGGQFDNDMYPIIRDNFGDPLVRDAATDNNGVLVALFTPIINNQFPAVAGFVSYCDQYPNAPGNSTSNFGEFFYAYLPTTAGTGYYAAGFNPDQWYWTIRDVFIHEVKHVASGAARVVNGAPFETSWLEEGTARHAEELWARTATDAAPWKANTGYGSAATLSSLYCAVRPTSAPCLAANNRRPSLDMYTHFATLYTAIDSTNATILSPFGPTPQDENSYFYALSWSLVRYADDRYGASDGGFLTALNQASNTGTANLAARAGVSIDQLLGGWALALAADDYPGLASPGADMRMDTWNLRAIYGGLHTDLPASFLAYPRRAASFGFGALGAVEVGTLQGGGVFTFDLSGTQSAPQLVRLRGAGGAALPSTVRVAITRVQ